MPAKGTILKFHGRYNFINKKLWKKYVAETGSKITYEEFISVVDCTLANIIKWVVREPIGFQLPKKLGHLAVNKFKTYGKFRAYAKSSDGTPLRLHNLHTGGYTFRIQLFNSTRKFKDRIPFWYFESCRDNNRYLGKVILANSHPAYNSYKQDHFVKTLK